MEIDPKHVAYTKVIGKLDGKNVVELGTTGGYIMVAVAKSTPEILGVGSHRALARFIAMKKRPELQITELAKGDYIPEKYFLDLLPRYEQLTDELNSRLGKNK